MPRDSASPCCANLGPLLRLSQHGALTQTRPKARSPRRGISGWGRRRLRGADSRRGPTRFLDPRYLGPTPILNPQPATWCCVATAWCCSLCLSPAGALPPQAREMAAWLQLRNQLLERADEGGSVVDSRRSLRLSASNNLARPAVPRPVPGVTPPGCGTRLWHSALAVALGVRLRVQASYTTTTGPRPYIQRPGPLNVNVSIKLIMPINLAPLGPYAEVGPACSASLRIRPPRLWRRASLRSAETPTQERAQ